jgi:aryl-alcohol dehydrogenase-like predicted oxidoreductase
MHTRRIGDVEVSAIGLGGMPMSIEGRPDEARSLATIHAALDAGVTLIDTADAYHRDAHEVGHNETLIAKALASHDRGGDVLVATKGGHLRPGDGSWTLDGSPRHLKEACEASLRRLGVEAIGLYQFHRPDPRVPYAESVGAVRDLLDEGKIRLAGISNAGPDQAGSGNPRRAPGLRAEPVLPGLPYQPAGAGAVRRTRHRVPALEPARRHLPRP